MRFVGPNPLTHTPDEMASKRSKFAVQAWLAVSAIEEELKKHSCDLEQKNMYAGRDWIFSIRMSISHGFSRFTPRPET